MPLRDDLQPVSRDETADLIAVWEASVRATHTFLAEEDIAFFRPLVADGVFSLPHLLGVREHDGRLVAFLGVGEETIEALFVRPDWRRRGIGRRLVAYARRELGATRVDVNEQNPEAIAFYRRQGFEVVGRSPLDAHGKPFPILHMRSTA